MNLGTYLDTAVTKYQDKPLLQFYDQTISYREFGERVNKLANGGRIVSFHIFAAAQTAGLINTDLFR